MYNHLITLISTWYNQHIDHVTIHRLHDFRLINLILAAPSSVSVDSLTQSSVLHVSEVLLLDQILEPLVITIVSIFDFFYLILSV